MSTFKSCPNYYPVVFGRHLIGNNFVPGKHHFKKSNVPHQFFICNILLQKFPCFGNAAKGIKIADDKFFVLL